MTKPVRCNNDEMWKYSTSREPFRNNNDTAYGRWWYDRVYVVYSYGDHFPIYVYDSDAGHWYGNQDKYSATTTRHQRHARPARGHIEWTNTDTIRRIAQYGVAQAVANRMESTAT